MPIYLENVNTSEVIYHLTEITDNNKYLLTNLDLDGMNTPSGYLALSSGNWTNNAAYVVIYNSDLINNIVEYNYSNGVRPVITVTL